MPQWSTSRVEAFSDGVFAIAITLLVLEIGIDPEAFEDPWRALADEWPSYLAYVTSFLTIGSVWLAHNRLFSRIEALDATMMRLNLLLLLVVSFLPFPTGLVAEALQESRDVERAAIVVYGCVALTIEFLLAAMMRRAGEEAVPGTVRGAVYAVVIVVAISFIPKAAAFGYLAVAIYAVVSARGEGQLTPHPTRRTR
jgi:uncharacterized membrane protein